MWMALLLAAIRERLGRRPPDARFGREASVIAGGMLAVASRQKGRASRSRLDCGNGRRLSGKASAVWISPTATSSWPQPSRSAATPRAETAGTFGDFHRRDGPGGIYPT